MLHKAAVAPYTVSEKVPADADLVQYASDLMLVVESAEA